MTQRAVVGPFGELDLGDQLRLDPVRSARFRAERRIVKRTFLLCQAGKLRTELRERRIVESCSDLSRVAEAAVRLIDAEQQCAEPMARAFGIGKTADHHFLATMTLGLLPRGTAAHLVRKVRALRHHAFKPEL